MPTQAKEGAAVEGTTTQATTQIPFATALEGGLGHTLLQMGGAVLVVVALILFLQRLAKRYRPGFGGRGKDVGIEVLSQRTLGNRLSLLVVEAQGQTFLLGTSPQGISTLAELGSGKGGHAVRPQASSGFSSERVVAMPSPPELVDVMTPSSRGASTCASSTPASSTREATAMRAASTRESATSESFAPAAAVHAPSVRASSAATSDRSKLGSGDGRRGFASGALRSIAALAVSRRPQEAPRSGLADLEEAARIAREARDRDEAAASGTPKDPFDQQEFEREFRDKLRAIREKYQTLDEAEGRRA